MSTGYCSFNGFLAFLCIHNCHPNILKDVIRELRASPPVASIHYFLVMISKFSDTIKKGNHNGTFVGLRNKLFRNRNDYFQHL